MSPDIDDAWWALCRSLDTCGRLLQEEVRTYPTPIARCDVQLTKVIEQRDAAFRYLRSAGELARIRPVAEPSEWRRRLREFATGLESLEDEGVAAARERVMAALEH
ncbi:MAG TPA: hypothetical protein VFR86_01840 [Burkholderiaceae bacterium]|nr:hypothetical protein [Burkholderiaceae bacterium]